MYKYRLVEEHGKDAPEHFKVVQPAGIGGGVVGHKEPEKDQNEVLEAESKVVDRTPVSVLSDDTGEDAGDENAEEEAGDDNG